MTVAPTALLPNALLPDAMTGACRILVLAPHPDDETLGCGTVLTRAFAGAGAHVVCITDGGASHPGSRDWSRGRLARLRRYEMRTAIRRLGGRDTDLTWLGLPDGRLHESDPASIASRLVRLVDRTGAEAVFVPSGDDHHSDHKATARCARVLRDRRPALTYFTYPVWSRYDDPDFTRSIAAHAAIHRVPPNGPARKRYALEAHASQMGRVVTDDSTGFVLPQAFVDLFVSEDELFWSMP